MRLSSRLKTLFRAYRRRRDGSMAVEFALLLMPFLILTVGSLELAIVHLTRSSLSHAVNEGYRPIFTGSTQCATVDEVKTALCSSVTLASMDSCKANMKIRLEPLASFDTTPGALANFNNMQETVSPGQPEQIMIMRILYKYEFLAPLMDKTLGGTNGELILAENIVFRTEPFASGTCPPPTP